jgi:hypothetical protein
MVKKATQEDDKKQPSLWVGLTILRDRERERERKERERVR